MKRITVTIKAVIELPDTQPPADYLRAVGNYVADWAPASVPKDGGLNPIASVKDWQPGREVHMGVHMEVAAEVIADRPAFQHVEPADTQGSLL